MKVVNCTWELTNIGKKTCEVSIVPDEILNKSIIEDLSKEYEYVVVKANSTNAQNFFILSELGFSFIETQLAIQKNISQEAIITDSVLNHFLKNSSLMKIETDEDLHSVLNNMTPNMFTTDRIYLDTHFGAEYSLNRYKNWIKTEFGKNTPLYKLIYKGSNVGFIMFKSEENAVDALLGGIYEKYQNRGLGILLPLVPYMIQDHPDWYCTHISSNNMPVWKMYERLHYSITNFEYVFVKHNCI